MKSSRIPALASILAATVFLSAPCRAGGPETSAQGLLYVDIPLGASSTRNLAPTFGFMVRAGQAATGDTVNSLRALPIVDVRFGAGSHPSVRILGVSANRAYRAYRPGAHADEVASANGSGDVNWWVVGPAVGAAVILIGRSARGGSGQTCTAPPGSGCQ